MVSLIRNTVPFAFMCDFHKGFCTVRRDEENFCATVPKDGRSYSPTLFSQTVRVLKKINKPGDMIVSFSLLADKIKVNRRCLSPLHCPFDLTLAPVQSLQMCGISLAVCPSLSLLMCIVFQSQSLLMCII